MTKIAKFNIGDVVVHKGFRYRAIVVDIDPLFQASGRYNPQAQKRDFATQNPWYRLLVDGSNQMTYVEECTLVLDQNQQPVDNPGIANYLQKGKSGYHPLRFKH